MTTKPEPEEVWYHATDHKLAVDILSNGFTHLHNWFARERDVALSMGRGNVLLATCLKDVPLHNSDGEELWQTCIHEFIPPEKVWLIEEVDKC